MGVLNALHKKDLAAEEDRYAPFENPSTELQEMAASRTMGGFGSYWVCVGGFMMAQLA